jgi:hypothetical protein
LTIYFQVSRIACGHERKAHLLRQKQDVALHKRINRTRNPTDAAKRHHRIFQRRAKVLLEMLTARAAILQNLYIYMILNSHRRKELRTRYLFSSQIIFIFISIYYIADIQTPHHHGVGFSEAGPTAITLIPTSQCCKVPQSQHLMHVFD